MDERAAGLAAPSYGDVTAEHGTTDVGSASARRSWLSYLLVGLAVVGLYQITPWAIGKDVIYVVLGSAAAAAIVVGVRRYRPRRPMPWYLMAAGQLSWSIADAIFAWNADVLHNDRFPTPADLFYLVGYPITAAALLLLIRARTPARDVGGWLDSLTVTAGLTLLSWVVFIEPMLARADGPVLGTAITVAYPIGDILLIGGMARLLTTSGRRLPSLRFLFVALALLILVDSIASGLDLMTYDSTEKINFLWLLSYVLWGASALHPSMRIVAEPADGEEFHFTGLRLAAVTIAVLIAPGTLAVQKITSQSLDVWAVVIGSVAMFLLVVGRMTLAIRSILVANQGRERARQEVAHQAAHDALTGLPNRAQAMRLISAALSRAERSRATVALLFLDLDGFKQVNDSLGHAAGDEVLRVVARRLRSEIRAGDVAARLGGDEFVVLLEPIEEQDRALRVADRLIAILSSPISLAGGHTAHIGASVGIAFNSAAAADAETLLNEADVAVYRAKSTGRGHAELFDESLRSELSERTRLEAALSAAIEHDELVLHYQPIVDLVTDLVEGYEALVRWNRPGEGLVPPDRFIPVAEQSDLICALDAWVLKHATQQLADWDRSGHRESLMVSVNISARHMARRRIHDDVAAALHSSGIEPRRLVLEVTETALIDDSAAFTNLVTLRALGISIAIDDFGTGYSSIARLRNLPADIVKIDRQFLDPNSPATENLLRLIVQSVHAFGLSVVVEGVEHDDQLKLIRSLHCEAAQGYYLGRPAEPLQIPQLASAAYSGDPSV